MPYKNGLLAPSIAMIVASLALFALGAVRMFERHWIAAPDSDMLILIGAIGLFAGLVLGFYGQTRANRKNARALMDAALKSTNIFANPQLVTRPSSQYRD